MLHLGLDIGGTKTEAVLLDDNGQSRFRERIATCKDSYPRFLHHLVTFIQRIAVCAGQPFSLGIGLPGAVDPQTGLIKNSNCLVLNGHDLRKDLTEELGQPVSLANDADCFTLSEAVDGAGKGGGTVFGVIVGTGCGGGVVVNNQLLQGPNAIAGEWGHNPLPGYNPDYDGQSQLCYCGNNNCIERFISGTGFATRFNQQWQNSYTSEQIIMAAMQGDKKAQAHYWHFIDAFARSLASVINILDPHVIVLGGGLSNVDSLYQDLPPAVIRYLFSDSCRTRIVQATYGDSSGVRGAAWLPGRAV